VQKLLLSAHDLISRRWKQPLVAEIRRGYQRVINKRGYMSGHKKAAGEKLSSR
jgi:hypothetical protein